MREIPEGAPERAPNVMHQTLPVMYHIQRLSLSLSCTHTHTSQPKAKGVEGLIEISNPNRVASKAKKATDIDVNAKVELSRRER